jgi:HlyD family secretion protein
MKRGAIVGWGLVVVLGAAVGLKYKSKSAAELEAKAGPPKGGRTPVVEVATAGPKEIIIQLNSTGALESPNRVEVAPRSSGQISEILVREGDRVKAGQVLVKLNPVTEQANLANAKAVLAEAKSRLAQARIQKGVTDSSVEGALDQQNAALVAAQNDLKLATQNLKSQVEVGEAAVEVANTRLSGAKASLKAAEAAVSREVAALSNQEVILERQRALFEKGFVSEQSFNNASTACEVQKRQVDVSKASAEASGQQVKQAEADLISAKALLAQTTRTGKTAIANAEARVKQAQGSTRVAKGNIGQSPAFKENLKALGSVVEAAEAQVRVAEIALEQTILRSPVDGVVASRAIDPGAMASASTPILVVQSDGWLFFRCSLPVEQSNELKVGFPSEIALAGNQKYQGEISAVGGIADGTNRRVSILVRLQNAGNEAKPGTDGMASFVLKRIKAACVVPKEAILEGTVSVVDEKNKVSLRTVREGATDGKQVEILDGVKPGEKVVTMTYSRLKDGQEVKIPSKKGSGGKGSGSEKSGDRKSSEKKEIKS